MLRDLSQVSAQGCLGPMDLLLSSQLLKPFITYDRMTDLWFRLQALTC